MATDEVYRRMVASDADLLASLNGGDADTHDEVAGMFRATHLRALRGHVRPLVNVLAACPELDPKLRSAWRRQDPEFTAQLFAWVAQRRALAA